VGRRAGGARHRARGRADPQPPGIEITWSYPELQPLATAAPPITVLDGEVVAFGDRGQSDFGVLQQRMHVGHPTDALLAAVPVLLVVFDLLALGGTGTTALSYGERRELLEAPHLTGPSRQCPPTVDLPGQQLLRASAAQRLEGVVARLRTPPYLPGRAAAGARDALAQQQQQQLPRRRRDGRGRGGRRAGGRAAVPGQDQPGEAEARGLKNLARSSPV